MNREDKIAWLIDRAMDGWSSNRDFDIWVAGILREGCVGYNTYTDEQLDQEMIDCGYEEETDTEWL